MDTKQSLFVQNLVFAIIILLAFLNMQTYYVLAGLWGVIGSIVCPLIVTVLPGCFFYYVLKENEVDSGYLKIYGIAYSLFGLIILPIFLTLSTKNLFSTS